MYVVSPKHERVKKSRIREKTVRDVSSFSPKHERRNKKNVRETSRVSKHERRKKKA